MEDQGIIALFFERSEQAIEETDKKYGRYCYSIAYNILSNREDSEESVSDTYLAVWNTIPPRRPNFLNAFLAKMTRHISIDRWRKLSAKKRGGGEIILALEELEECVDRSNVETEMAKKELISIVRASSDEEKAKSVMVEEYDLTEDEVTLLLDMTMSDIVENKQDWLDYYRTSVNALSRLVGEKEETDSTTSYIELVTH